jgi:hypothetical protein
VNHVVDHGTVVFRTARGSQFWGSAGLPVAFEVDGYDASSGRAWSVVVHGQGEVLIRSDSCAGGTAAAHLPLAEWGETRVRPYRSRRNHREALLGPRRRALPVGFAAVAVRAQEATAHAGNATASNPPRGQIHASAPPGADVEVDDPYAVRWRRTDAPDFTRRTMIEH